MFTPDYCPACELPEIPFTDCTESAGGLHPAWSDYAVSMTEVLTRAEFIEWCYDNGLLDNNDEYWTNLIEDAF